MRREGSPWTGLGAVLAKETAEHLTGWRMRILEPLIFLAAAVPVYAAIQNLRSTVGEDPFVFLRLFTTSQEPIPAFVAFLGLLAPLLAMVLGFDAINGEFNRRTLSRVLAQPVYRDALLLGKFLGALFTLTIVLTAIWLLIMGFGILLLGLAPSGEEVARSLLFLLATVAYSGVWLGLAMVFSVVFRQPATAALAAIAVWLFFTIFWSIVAAGVAQVFYPVRTGLLRDLIAQAELELGLARVSPNTLYSEAIITLLKPNVRALGIVLPIQLQGAILSTPLPLGQSLLLIWPQLTGLIAETILLFAVGYVLFQRQEIRA